MLGAVVLGLDARRHELHASVDELDQFARLRRRVEAGVEPLGDGRADLTQTIDRLGGGDRSPPPCNVYASSFLTRSGTSG